jgi:hypothetical protein
MIGGLPDVGTTPQPLAVADSAPGDKPRPALRCAPAGSCCHPAQITRHVCCRPAHRHTSSVMSRNAVVPHPLAIIEQLPATALAQLLDRLRRPHRRQTLQNHQPHGHGQRKDATVPDCLQIAFQTIKKILRHHLAKSAKDRSRLTYPCFSTCAGLLIRLSTT